MGGVSEPSVIDIVAHDPITGEYILVMVEDRPWGSDPLQKIQLREKINTYAAFVLDGSLAQHYPEAADQPARLQLHCEDTPNQEILDIVGFGASKLEPYGLRIVVKVRDT